MMVEPLIMKQDSDAFRRAKLGCFVTKVFPKTMQSVLVSNIRETALQSKYQQDDLKIGLTYEEKKLMDELPKIENFTSELCFKILRFEKLIPEPKGKWGNIPERGNVTIADDIQRIIFASNDVISIPIVEFTEDFYCKFLYKTEPILVRIDKFLREGVCHNYYKEIFSKGIDVHARLKDLEYCSCIEVTDIFQNWKTEERERYSKLAILITEMFPEILRTILQYHCQVSAIDIYNIYLPNFWHIFHSGEKHMLTKISSTLTFKSLDITTICKLIRLFVDQIGSSAFSLTGNPAQGWDKPPNKGDLDILDDIVRIRHLRNEILHRPDTALDQMSYDNYFGSFIDISKRMDGYFHKVGKKFGFEDKVSEVKTCILDYSTKQRYEKALKDVEHTVARFTCEPITFHWGDSFEKSLKEIRELMATEKNKGKEVVHLHIIIENVEDSEKIAKILNELKDDLSTMYSKVNWVKAGCIILCVDIMYAALESDDKLISELNSLVQNIRNAEGVDISSENEFHASLVLIEDYTETQMTKARNKVVARNDKRATVSNTLHVQLETQMSIYETDERLENELADVLNRVRERTNEGGNTRNFSATLLPIKIDKTFHGDKTVVCTSSISEDINRSDVPDSNKTDIDLMTSLPRNLPRITLSHKGYRCFGTNIEIVEDADSAIERLREHQMINECDQLNTKPLDQTQNVMLKDTKRYFDASFQGDTVPRHIREQFQKTIEIWKNEDQMFVETRAAKNILKCIQQNNCVTITASSGVGKTAVLQHVALQMNADGYDILPLTDPGDIVKFYNQNQKTLFVFDDLCGSFSLDQTKTKIWEPVIERIEGILEDLHAKIIVACRLKVYQDDKFETLLSIFMSCVCNLLSENISLLKTEKQSIADIYLETKAHEITNYYDSYDFFPLLCLLYHKNPTFDIKDFFQNPFIFYKTQIDQLQKNGFFGKYCALALCVVFNNEITEEILTEEINMETRTIIENTCEACKLDRGTSRLILKQELDSLSNTFLKKQGTSYHNLKSQSYYTTIHDKIFDFLAKYFGQKIIDCLIKNADSSFIRERFLLERRHDMNQLMTNVPSKYYKLFMQRIIDDWSKGKLQDVFNNNNMKIPQFRQRLLCYLNELETSYQKQLVHTNDAYCNRTVMSQDYYTDVICDTVMLQCSFIGDLLMILWCCDLGVDVNQCGYLGQSPLMTASRYGHTEIVRLLLNKGANYNKCDLYGQSPVMMACRYGHVEIVKMLIDKGADYNKCNNRKESPITMACRCEHSEIVKLLLNRGADCNKCDTFSQSLLMFGSRQGHIQTVRMSNDYSKYDFRDQSPLFEAIENRRIEVIKMLLDKRADYNQYDFYGQLPLMKACENGRTEIVKMLLKKGADCTQPYNEDGSPVMIALNHGYTEIVKMLIDKGANYYTFNEFGQSPFIVVCTNDHSKIVKILIDKGADFKKCYFRCQSSLTKACIKCRTELVKMLLDKGADCNQLDNEGVSPVMIAVNHGYTEIVKMLIDKGANYNTFIELGQSPVIVASLNGLSEIVKILIDKGVDLNKCDFRG